MNQAPAARAFESLKFGVGQPVARTEDPMLVRGAGAYTDDLAAPGALHAVFLRSQHAHGLLRAVDAGAARAMPGVAAIYDGAQLAAAGYAGLKCMLPLTNADGAPMRAPDRPALAIGRVRHVGEPIACVLAETLDQARDAAEAILVDIEPLPVVLDEDAARAAGAPALFDDLPGNVVLESRTGDAAATEAAFARAAHVARLRLVDQRLAVACLETRAAIAEYDAASERFTLRAPSQGVFGLRAMLAATLRIAPQKLHVLTGQVGGSFGMKGAVFPELVCLMHAARALGRPARWTDGRSDSFLSDTHGRDMAFNAELALDAEGNFLALRVVGAGNIGAYTTLVSPLMPCGVAVRNLPGMYRTPAMDIRMQAVLTNTPPIGAYRGAGRPEGNYVMERLIEEAARISGLSAIDLRLKNAVTPADMPFHSPVGSVWDSGDCAALVAHALEVADWDGYAARKADSEGRGLIRGRGIGAYLEATAPPANEMGGLHFEQDGTVTIVTGTLDFGQGHATTFSQVLVTELGVPFDKIRFVQGDSDRLIAGGGTGGSKSTMASGAAVIEAAREVIARGRKLAGFLLETAEADIEFADGRFTVAGTDRAIDVLELAARLRAGITLPDDMPRTLDVDHVHKASPAAYPNGCHVAEVEIDPETGETRLVRYTMVNDFGVVVNPMLVEGQMHGGVVQGLGQVMMERIVFDEQGQLITGGFTDYAMPRAADAPFFTIESRPTRATTNPLGAKGCGEAGCSGAMPAIMNAVLDALRPHGVTHMDMPATPDRVWRAMRAAR